METPQKLRCSDCIHLAPVDVFSGICNITKQSISMDAETCSEFEPVPKCKFCSEYKPIQGEEFLGTCGSSIPTYPDLVAKTCESFRWAEPVPGPRGPKAGRSASQP